MGAGNKVLATELQKASGEALSELCRSRLAASPPKLYFGQRENSILRAYNIARYEAN